MADRRNRTTAIIAVAAFMSAPLAYGQGSKAKWEKSNISCFESLSAGDLSSARRTCSEAVRLAESITGDVVPLAKSLSNLGTLLQRLGEYSLAETAYTRALKAAEQSSGKDSTLAALAAGAVGLLYIEAERFSEADPLLRRALATDEKVLGPNSDYVATDLNNLGLLRIKQKRFPEAETMLNRSLSITEKLFGRDHHESMETMNNLGTVYFELGKAREAEFMLRRVLAFRETSLPAMDLDIAESLN
jgi:tetratricopeptide (TPR) repeat protein